MLLEIRTWLKPLGRNATWMPSLLLVFLGVFTLVVLSGVLGGVAQGLRDEVVGSVFWLLLFTLFAIDAATLWADDAADGTLDQAFVEAGGSYLPLLGRAFVAQIFSFFMPLTLVFIGLWMLGLPGVALPWLALTGLVLPLAALRLMASALALSVRGLFPVGSLFFLSLGSIFFVAAVAGRGDLVWAMGLIFAPLCLIFVPHTLSLSHEAR